MLLPKIFGREALKKSVHDTQRLLDDLSEVTVDDYRKMMHSYFGEDRKWFMKDEKERLLSSRQPELGNIVNANIFSNSDHVMIIAKSIDVKSDNSLPDLKYEINKFLKEGKILDIILDTSSNYSQSDIYSYLTNKHNSLLTVTIRTTTPEFLNDLKEIEPGDKHILFCVIGDDSRFNLKYQTNDYKDSFSYFSGKNNEVTNKLLNLFNKHWSSCSDFNNTKEVCRQSFREGHLSDKRLDSAGLDNAFEIWWKDKTASI